MKANKLIFLILLLFSTANAQVAIGKTTVNNAAVLDIDNAGNKAVILPKVDIVDVLSNLQPVNSPADGLIVYNLGNTISPGLYQWKNSRWNQLADTYNLVSYLILQRTSDYSVLSGLSNNSYKNFDDVQFTILRNDIGAAYNTSNGIITLPGNSGYVVNMCLNINTTNESASTGVAGTPVHVHNYVVKLIDPSTGIQYGKSLNVNAESLAISGARSHTINVSFAFVTNSAIPINLLPAIAHADGGTYSNGIGGASPNDGTIIIKNTKIDIQRSPFLQ